MAHARSRVYSSPEVRRIAVKNTPLKMYNPDIPSGFCFRGFFPKILEIEKDRARGSLPSNVEVVVF